MNKKKKTPSKKLSSKDLSYLGRRHMYTLVHALPKEATPSLPSQAESSSEAGASDEDAYVEEDTVTWETLPSRTKSRLLAFQGLYAYDSGNALEDGWFPWSTPVRATEYAYAWELLQGTIQHLNVIDTMIRDKLREWKFERISDVNRAILRLSIYSLLWQRSVPRHVTINEGVLLAKWFGDVASYKFVNAVLDKVDVSSLEI